MSHALLSTRNQHFAPNSVVSLSNSTIHAVHVFLCPFIVLWTTGSSIAHNFPSTPSKNNRIIPSESDVFKEQAQKLHKHGAINKPSLSTLDVIVLVDGKKLTSGSVPVNASKHVLPFSLSSLEPRTGAYSLTCTASIGNGEQVVGSSLLTYLPANIEGVTKMDMHSGTLLATGEDGLYERVFPIGFYSNFGGYLDSNLSIESTLKNQGFTIVHPISTFDNTSILNEVLDEMQKNGLWLMYNMRLTYMNDTSVTEQVNQIKSRPNLLLWYSADEPDGTSDP
ncbi:hypothetical protein BT96DRAFT_940044 [Gymnopus androsaceus JB14]|uniref:Uncharacterized protein n=1 Tax=Gymnopus androsaceus JB14 TaxID=1447944 RepID=A0A6A4HLQ4_9AGAR|nr:hypothetical protein BT96DRAFT_940044 [Gymnopus androsaceus JB14]